MGGTQHSGNRPGKRQSRVTILGPRLGSPRQEKHSGDVVTSLNVPVSDRFPLTSKYLSRVAQRHDSGFWHWSVPYGPTDRRWNRNKKKKNLMLRLSVPTWEDGLRELLARAEPSNLRFGLWYYVLATSHSAFLSGSSLNREGVHIWLFIVINHCLPFLQMMDLLLFGVYPQIF